MKNFFVIFFGLLIVYFFVFTSPYNAVAATAAYDSSANAACDNSTNPCAGGTTLTYPITVGNNSNRQLAVFAFVGCNSGETAPTVSSVTYAGVALGQTVVVNTGTNARGYLYTLPAGIQPNTGTNNVVVTLASSLAMACGSWADTLTSGAISAYNVDQASIYASAPISNSGSGTSATLNGFTSGANDLGISSICAGNGITNTTETSLWTSIATTNSCGSNGGVRAAGGDTSFSWTIPSDSWIIIGGAFKGASGGPADTTPPSTPTNLSATAVSSSQINLLWTASTDNVGVTGYDIYRGGTLLTSVTGTSYSNTGLSPSTLYTYTVRSKDAAGNTSAQSSAASATTQAAQTGNTITAASCSQTDVQNAINSVTIGGTVNVPAGSCSWSGFSITKALTLQGAGIAQTNITLTGSVNITKQSTGIVRIKGFSISKTGGGNESKGIIISGLWQGTEPVVIEDNSFIISNSGLFLLNVAGGVIIAHNSFTGGWDDSFIQPKHPQDPENSWHTADTMGARDTNGKLNHYIEDNTFYGGTNQGIDCDDSTRCVYRYNDLTYSSFNTHGWDSSPVGVRHFEVYNNRMHHYGETTALANQNWGVWIRGGTGVIFNNQIDNLSGSYWGDKAEYKFSIRGAEDDRVQGTCAQVSYPVPHQLGQNNNGTSDFTDPIYMWGNAGFSAIDANWHWGNPCGLTFTDFFKLGRDYFVNSGAKPGYTAYTYPHPLRSGGTPPSDTTAPSTPTNLSATAVSSSQINLSWTASTDNTAVTGYKIFRAGAQVGTSATNSYSDSGLSASTNYSYTVSAYDAANNNSAQSSPGSATTQAASSGGTCQAVSPAKCWYVDSAVASSGNGTSWATAWKNFSNITGLNAGDIVYFSGGTTSKSYIVNNWTPTGGTSGNPITYKVGQDAGHNGMVTVSSTNFINGTIHDVVIDGNVSGQQRWSVTTSGYLWEGGSGTNQRVTIKYITVPNMRAGFHWSTASNTGLEIAYNNIVKDNDYLNINDFIFYGGPGTSAGQVSVHDNYIQFPMWTSDHSYGDDMWIWPGNLNFYNNTVRGMRRSTYGSGSVQHSDVFQSRASNIKVYNNTFIDPGESVYYEDSNSGGVFSNIMVYNNLIVRTFACNGGAQRIFDMNPEGAGIGNAAYVDMVIANNTIVDNTGSCVFAIRVAGAGTYTRVYVVNNLGFPTGADVSTDTGITVSNNYNGNAAQFTSYSQYSGTNNDLHLTGADTVALGKGRDMSAYFSADKDGNTRTGTWDIGAYEFVGGTGQPVPGDLNSDHIVNALDYSLLNSKWLQSFSAYDLQVDGLINSLDFAILSSNWGRTW